MFCINCGNKLITGSNFCTRCGAKINNDNTDVATAAEFADMRPEKETEHNLKRGKECFDGGVYEVAFRYFQEAAEQGHIEAQYRLAKMYQEGLGVFESKKHAAQWFDKAAEQGHAEAQYSLALQYMHGKGVQQDFEIALKWLTLSSEQGLQNALCTLGKQYEGDILPESLLPRDINKAKELYIKAINMGSKEAVMNLAMLDFRIQASGFKSTFNWNAFIFAMADFFRKTSSLAKEDSDFKSIHILSISENFDKKMQGALTYAKLERNEIPLILIDSTIFGSAKEGALFTTHALYIKSSAAAPKVIFHPNVQSISIVNATTYYKITVNGNPIDLLIRNESNALLLRDFLKSVIFSLQI